MCPYSLLKLVLCKRSQALSYTHGILDETVKDMEVPLGINNPITGIRNKLNAACSLTNKKEKELEEKDR